jgi:hypothetical protein
MCGQARPYGKECRDPRERGVCSHKEDGERCHPGNVIFHVHDLPTIARHVALTSTATILVACVAHQAGHPIISALLHAFSLMCGRIYE